jgi:hypothetical protein
MRERRLWLALMPALIFLPAAIGPPAGGGASEPPRMFEVRVPETWRTAGRLMLVARDVTVPKNRPVIFEFFATAEGKKAELLGSYGVVAESETASGDWHFESIRVNVTRSLRRWLDVNPATTISIRVDVVDGDRTPVRDLRWNAQSIAIETPPAR